MKHTPGPWKVYESNRFPTIAISGDKGSVRVANTYGELDYQRQIANALLIAAAPELLEACEALKAWYEDDEAAPFDAPMSLIDAAIAKAKGES